ncbi:MAG: MTH1187 family thiamine-binding protein [Halobacteriota archaeon]|nr:MTH1187 family thiamine-binding protein [Halobacteriota archaeon]
MAIVEVSIVPLCTKSPSLSRYVADTLKVLSEDEDLRFELTPMGTIIEGDLERILGAVKRMHETVFSEEVRRVVTTIKIDDRRDKSATMERKVKSVQDKLAGD